MLFSATPTEIKKNKPPIGPTPTIPQKSAQAERFQNLKFEFQI